jgi:Mrp family chromosome partitioning ATPase
MQGVGAAEISTDEHGRTSVTEQNLYSLTSADPEARPVVATSELIRYDRLLPIIRERDYAFVVIDIPPVSEGYQPLRLGGPMDGVLLVIEAEKIRWEVAQWAKGLLEEANASLLGAVLNKRRFYVPAWLYRRL